jgi:hypothetical protein
MRRYLTNIRFPVYGKPGIPDQIMARLQGVLAAKPVDWNRK